LLRNQFNKKKKIPGILGFFFYPIILEPLANIISILVYKESNYEEKHSKKHFSMRRSIGLIYHPRYNITACGIEKCHPFDSIKYQRIIHDLRMKGLIKNDEDIFSPEKASRSTLTKVSCR
jgi:histone deacetylase 11